MIYCLEIQMKRQKNVPTTHQNSIAAKVAPKGFYELLEKEASQTN